MYHCPVFINVKQQVYACTCTLGICHRKIPERFELLRSFCSNELQAEQEETFIYILSLDHWDCLFKFNTFQSTCSEINKMKMLLQTEN